MCNCPVFSAILNKKKQTTVFSWILTFSKWSTKSLSFNYPTLTQNTTSIGIQEQTKERDEKKLFRGLNNYDFLLIEFQIFEAEKLK